MRALVAAGALIALIAIDTLAALAAPPAEPPPEVNCGLVSAYVPPSGSQDGGVTFLWRSAPFAVQFGPGSPADLVNRVACVHQRMTTSGPRWAADLIPAPFCGRVSAYPYDTPAIGNAIVVAHDGFLDYQVTFAITPGVVLPSEVVRDFSGCFDVGVLTNGYPAIVGVRSTIATAPPAASSGANLPNTATDVSIVPLLAAVTALGVVLLTAVLLSRPVRRGS